MTNKEINERVAKLCGWTQKQCGEQFWISPDREYENWGPQPYATCLDACREFMSQIDGVDREDFLIVARRLDRTDTLYEYEELWALITLTPRELCEVFLRLKGQWE